MDRVLTDRFHIGDSTSRLGDLLGLSLFNGRHLLSAIAQSIFQAGSTCSQFSDSTR